MDNQNKQPKQPEARKQDELKQRDQQKPKGGIDREPSLNPDTQKSEIHPAD
jgi:hypothetical protein